MPRACPQGWIHEIFPSIQGEGTYCGQSQTFVRFAGCNLACDCCDTQQSRSSKPESCCVDDPREIQNPLSVEAVADVCARFGRRVVSLTGGEPLLQVDFLAALMGELGKRGMFNYLETNGTLFKELPLVVRSADCIAMDIKLPSATGQDAQWDAHARFLEIASGTEVFVKTVVIGETPGDEILRCADLIAAVDRRTTLVIQPACGSVFKGARLIELQDLALTKLDDVRVIPQCHKALGLR